MSDIYTEVVDDLLLEDYPVYVFEETTVGFDKFAGRGLTSYQGGGYPLRDQYVACYHIVECARKQLYSFREAHKTPHYSIPHNQIEEFTYHLEGLGREMGTDIQYYYRHTSYIGTSQFIRVWNYGTEEFMEIEELFGALDFGKTIRFCDNRHPGERGNRQVCVGFSHLNRKKRDPRTHVSIPQVNNHTEAFVDDLVKLSKLGVALGIIGSAAGITASNVPKEILRKETFPQHLHTECEVEAGTFAVSDPTAPLLVCHLDSPNCREPGHDYIMVASSMFLRWESVEQDGTVRANLNVTPAIVRGAQIVYDRKACADYVNQVILTGPIIRDVRKWLLDVPLSQFGINDKFVSTASTMVKCASLKNTMYYTPSNLDKCVFLSTFVEMILRLDERFLLSMQQMCEVILPMAWLNSTYKYWFILQSWLDKDLLPPGNLTVAFCTEATRQFGGFSSGPKPRFSPSCCKPMAIVGILDSLRGLLDAITTVNSLDAGKITHLTYSRLCGMIEHRVINAGSLTSQHVASVLCLTGVVRHAFLASQAETATGTRCFKRMKEGYGVSKLQMDVSIRVLASSLNQNPNVAENTLCSFGKKKGSPKKYDSVIVDQRVHFARKISKKWRICYVGAGVEDGGCRLAVFRERATEDNRFHPEAIRWWDSGSTAGINDRYKGSSISPTTKQKPPTYRVLTLSCKDASVISVRASGILSERTVQRPPIPKVLVLPRVELINMDAQDSIRKVLHTGKLRLLDLRKQLSPAGGIRLQRCVAEEVTTKARYGFVPTHWSSRKVDPSNLSSTDGMGSDVSIMSDDNPVNEHVWEYIVNDDEDWVPIEAPVARLTVASDIYSISPGKRKKPQLPSTRRTPVKQTEEVSTRKGTVRHVADKKITVDAILSIVRPWKAGNLMRLVEFILTGTFRDGWLANHTVVGIRYNPKKQVGWYATMAPADRIIDYSLKEITFRLFDRTQRSIGWQQFENLPPRYLYNDKRAASQALLISVILDNTQEEWRVNKRTWATDAFTQRSTTVVPVTNGPGGTGLPIFTLVMQGDGSVTAVFIIGDGKETVQYPFC